MMLETPADACAALAVLIAGADDVTTAEEHEYLFETMPGTPLLEHLDEAGMADRLMSATEWMYSSFPKSGGRLSDEAVSAILQLISEKIPPELRMEALRVAVGLAKADGVTAGEEQLLERVCEGLDIDPQSATQLLREGGA